MHVSSLHISSLLFPSLAPLAASIVVDMAAPALGAEIFSLGFRFNPKPIEAISYYLPRLIAGAPLHEAVRPVVHHADVYACEPSELARRFRPLPVTGHRFFFSTCKKGTRVAGPGSWAMQSAKDIKDADDNKVGEIKKLRYKKRGVFTDWLMDETSTCGLQEAVVGDRQLVFCKMYVSPKADSDSPAHQESAAFFASPPAPVVIAQAAAAAPPKRPAPLGADPPCPKRMRWVPVAPSHPVVQPPRPCVPPPPVTRSSPPASARSPTPAPTRLAMQAPAPSRPLGHPMQQKMLPTTTPPVVPVQAPARHCWRQASVQRKQKILVDPFEAMTDEADESPAALEDDDDWDDLAKCIEDVVPTAEAEEEVIS